ncbi:MAG: disulfide oxidoreductase [Paenibacillaceae bacterium]
MYKLRVFLIEQGLSLAWIIATVATLGSLYFSEVMGYLPCTLCWYQRILMYPLVIVLGIASARKDLKQTLYVLPITILGIGFSSYHYAIEKTDWFDREGKTCGIIPCDVAYINWLGFITIPFLALTAFTLITIILVAIRYAQKNTEE